MNKNPFEMNRMPGEKEDMKDKPRKEGEQQKKDRPDFNKGQQGPKGEHQGNPMNPQKDRETDPTRRRMPEDDQKKRPA